MIIKREMNNGVITTLYKSSNICESKYNTLTNNLDITFNNGGVYRYKGVSNADFTRFELADSQGKVFNTHIKQHAFEKLDKIDTTELLNEITNIEKEETESKKNYLTKEFFDVLESLVSYYKTTGQVEKNLYRTFKTKLEIFDKDVI